MSQNSRVDPSRFGRVVVLMGGTSAEREISLQSGRAVLEALLRAGIDAHGLDVGAGVVDQLHRQGYDRAFIALHGRGGEDGVIQGALELLGIPYTGSGVLGSALAMDKLRCKQVWLGAGTPTPAYCALHSARDLRTAADRLGMPLVVKPAHEGSSLGVSKVERMGDLEAAWQRARKYDAEVLGERWIHGVEYTASLLGDSPLALIRLETPRAFYDFEAKYQAPTTRYICPCGLPPSEEKRLQLLAVEAFRATGAEHWGRVDFLVDGDGKPWFIEVNTVPGMTDHSLVPMAARASGIEFDDLAVQILESSL